ncbi:hypothetical protein G7K71_00765 [Desulfofundulus sp. TPOSR]|jgi:hypothetical protein|uniref:hypothetical protein n=1 Tax=Desulfofundulus sp. TPOSR TaxID=2714340 RepID=UPI00140D6CBA|nr:hypothetical protein [Desulfofundulus sp. TPOSR]NHM25566.1 hypothetical protein [Desulfofundulus sp. TPOSR]
MKFWHVIITALFFLLLAKGSHPAANTTIKTQHEIYAIIKGAVEDDSWWQARNRNEVKEKLGRYYAEPMLSEVSERAWDFIARPTDWYCRATVADVSLKYLTSENALLSASLVNTDLVTGQIQKGTGYFSLHKTSSGWRIVSANYRWEKEINAH